MDSVTFGEFIRKKRIELGLPIREVAGQVGLDQSLLSKIERNKMQAPARIIRALGLCLGVDFKTLQKQYWSERIYQEIRNEAYGAEALELALRRLEKSGSGTDPETKKAQLLTKIRAYLDSQPIEKVWLFGSFARDEANFDSDIDLLVRFEDGHRIDLFDYIGIKQDLEDLTSRTIDLVEEGQEDPRIQPVIAKEKKLIYVRQSVQ